MLPLQGVPYGPGRARGVLRRGGPGATDRVLLLTHTELCRLQGTPAAIIVTGAAPLSHRMLRLIGAGIPTLLLTPAQAAGLEEGMEVTVDGDRGLLLEAGVAAPVAPEAVFLPPRSGAPVLTADGQAICLRASIPGAAGAEQALANGAEAIGLVRSEYLEPGGGLAPDAAFYATALTALCRVAHPLRVTLRLPDFSEDKRPSWFPTDLPLAPLGLQGVRLYGREPVRTVLGALLEAVGLVAQVFDLALLLPFVSRPEEYRRWRGEIEALLPAPIAVGVMVETPAAALEIPEWLLLADFICVGCNDLMQGLYGADRNLPDVGHLLDPHAPATFRFLQRLAEQAGEATAGVQLCGLLPQAPGVLPVLLGLGFRTFSVEPRLIPALARTVARTDCGTAEALARGVCAEPDAESARALLGLPRAAGWGVGAAGGIREPLSPT